MVTMYHMQCHNNTEREQVQIHPIPVMVATHTISCKVARHQITVAQVFSLTVGIIVNVLYFICFCNFKSNGKCLLNYYQDLCIVDVF